MCELAHPWLLVLAVLPLFAWRFLPAYRARQEAIRGPFFEQLQRVTGQEAQRGATVTKRGPVQIVLALFVWLLVVVAVARPEIVEDPIVKQVAARDLMLAVDLSGSMEADDFTDETGARIQRLDAVKLVLDDFIARREGDRIGLIVFGNAAYLQAPFTEDHETVRFLLEETRVRMAGPQTMLGDALGFAITRFEESGSKNRVLILLTDGNDTGSRMPPVKAAEIAAKHDITIHAIAMGDPATVGEEKLDLETLEKITTATGGQSFRAVDREALEATYRQLDELEPGLYETQSWRPRRPLYPFFLAAAIGLVLLFEIVAIARVAFRGRRPAHA